MEGRPARRKSGLGLLVLAALSSCSPRVAVEDLPTVEAALSSAGKRLSQSLATGDLTALATRGDKVLAALTPTERDALARGYLRFRIDRAAEVNVATPRSAPPFWLAEQGFTRTALALHDNKTDWVVYRKTFGPGWVGLGVNGLDRKPTAHYAVFLKTLDQIPVRISDLRETGWDVVRAESGVSLQNGLSKPVRALPGELRGATLLRTAHDRRHATLLARGRVWKTHVVATEKPDQVTVSFGADPSRELTWSWRTARDVTTSALWLRKVGAEEGRAEEFHGDSELISLPDLLNDPTVRRHTVRVSGLAPGTAYEYALGGMKASWQTVHTSPASSSDVSLLYLGDPQCGLENWGKLLAEAYRRRPDVGAVLIAGDLVDRGNERTNWDHFFLRASGVFDRLPVMPAVGNHEYLDRGPWLYRAVFALPENGPKGVAPDLVYSVEIGDAFIAVLDSTLAVSDPAQARLQAEWLDERLARTQPRVEARHVSPPALRLAHGAREPCAPRRLGPGVRPPPRRPRAPGTRPRLPADLPDARGPARRLAGRGDDLRRLRLGRQVLRPGPARLHRGRVHERLDLSDDRSESQGKPAGLPGVRRRGPRAWMGS